MSAPVLERLRSAVGDRYAIERELGSGAMATVYLARDIKHHRDVAIKVVHADAVSPSSAERFLREVDVLAHLHHPHILPLFDSGEADGMLYYVMPRVEGESLRDRLEREHQLPVDEAVKIACDVAAALDYAHRHGVVHRDIKPANILLQDGQALVADFGIALARSATGGDRMTGTGVSIGTPSYMSPEQASGDREIDARSDVFALGAMLYEMLTGEPPHIGRDAHAVLAKVLTEPVRPIRARRPSVPPHVDAAVQKALAKLAADRFPSTAAFARSLTQSDGQAGSVGAVARSLANRLKPRSPAGVAGALALLTVTMLIGAWAWSLNKPASNMDGASVRRWSIVLPDSAPLAFVGTASLGVGRTSLAISPDGARLAYVAQRGPTTQLYVRELDRLAATPLSGTDGASQPFFSPDGQWIGFFAGRELKKVSLRGEQPVTLTTVTEPFGGAWAADGRILVVHRQGTQLGWMPSGGGALQPITRQIGVRMFGLELVAGDEWLLHGSIDGVLYLLSLSTGWSYAITRDAVVRRDSADLDAIVYGANPRYLRSGHIAYFSGDGTLMALPFDIVRRRVLGPAVPILDGVRLEAEAGGAQITVSHDGTLVYAPGESARLSQFAWVHHAAQRVDKLPLPRAGYGGFDLSPNGRQILVRLRSTSSRAELWVLDVDGGRRARVPTEGLIIGSPKWWPDGARMSYYELPASANGPVITLSHDLQNAARRDTLPLGTLGPAHDARHLVHVDRGVLSLISAEQPDRRVPLTLGGPSGGPAFSPDGRWLAYMDLDDPAGSVEVYVAPVGRPAERHKISAAGGDEPVWTPDGRSVIYRDRQEWLAVDVSTTGAFRAGRPRSLFRGPFLQVPGASHDIAPDGRRQLVLVGPSVEATTGLVVVTNWFAEVARLAPPGNR